MRKQSQPDGGAFAAAPSRATRPSQAQTSVARPNYGVQHAKNDGTLNALTQGSSLTDFLNLLGFGIPTEVSSEYNYRRNVSETTNAGLGWSHTFGYENILNGAFLYSESKSRTSTSLQVDDAPVLGLRDPDIIPFLDGTEDLSSKTYIGALSHSIGSGPLTWRYGIEGGWIDASTTTSSRLHELFPLVVIIPETTTGPDTFSNRVNISRAYIDVLHEITPDLKGEYALFGTHMEGDGVDVNRLEPRFGLAWTPAQNHWLRAAFMIGRSLGAVAPTILDIVPYAGFGAFYFLLSAIWLVVAAYRKAQA